MSLTIQFEKIKTILLASTNQNIYKILECLIKNGIKVPAYKGKNKEELVNVTINVLKNHANFNAGATACIPVNIQELLSSKSSGIFFKKKFIDFTDNELDEISLDDDITEKMLMEKAKKEDIVISTVLITKAFIIKNIRNELRLAKILQKNIKNITSDDLIFYNKYKKLNIPNDENFEDTVKAFILSEGGGSLDEPSSPKITGDIDSLTVDLAIIMTLPDLKVMTYEQLKDEIREQGYDIPLGIDASTMKVRIGKARTSKKEKIEKLLTELEEKEANEEGVEDEELEEKEATEEEEKDTAEVEEEDTEGEEEDTEGEDVENNKEKEGQSCGIIKGDLFGCKGKLICNLADGKCIYEKHLPKGVSVVKINGMKFAGIKSAIENLRSIISIGEDDTKFSEEVGDEEPEIDDLDTHLDQVTNSTSNIPSIPARLPEKSQLVAFLIRQQAMRRAPPVIIKALSSVSPLSAVFSKPIIVLKDGIDMDTLVKSIDELIIEKASGNRALISAQQKAKIAVKNLI